MLTLTRQRRKVTSSEPAGRESNRWSSTSAKYPTLAPSIVRALNFIKTMTFSSLRSGIGAPLLFSYSSWSLSTLLATHHHPNVPYLPINGHFFRFPKPQKSCLGLGTDIQRYDWAFRKWLAIYQSRLWLAFLNFSYHYNHKPPWQFSASY